MAELQLLGRMLAGLLRMPITVGAAFHVVDLGACASSCAAACRAHTHDDDDDDDDNRHSRHHHRHSETAPRRRSLSKLFRRS